LVAEDFCFLFIEWKRKAPQADGGKCWGAATIFTWLRCATQRRAESVDREEQRTLRYFLPEDTSLFAAYTYDANGNL